jgi:hypothetical protein
MGFGHVRVFGLPQGSQPSTVFILAAHWSYAQCAGLHRGLGVHVSFVRSIEMDTWSDVSGVRVTLRRTRLLTLVTFAGPAHCYEGTALFNGALFQPLLIGAMRCSGEAISALRMRSANLGARHSFIRMQSRTILLYPTPSSKSTIQTSQQHTERCK